MARSVTSALGTVSSTGTTTRTFSSVSIGTAAADRIVVAIIPHERGVCTGVTIGGVSATLLALGTNSSLAA